MDSASSVPTRYSRVKPGGDAHLREAALGNDVPNLDRVEREGGHGARAVHAADLLQPDLELLHLALEPLVLLLLRPELRRHLLRRFALLMCRPLRREVELAGAQPGRATASAAVDLGAQLLELREQGLPLLP